MPLTSPNSRKNEHRLPLNGADNTEIRGATFSTDGRTLLTTQLQEGIRVWDVATGKLLRNINKDENRQRAIFSPDGRFIFAGMGDLFHPAAVFDTASGNTVRTLSRDSVFDHHDIGEQILDTSPDGALAILANQESGIVIWDQRDPTTHRYLTSKVEFPSAVLLAPDDRTIATEGSDVGLTVWDPETGRPGARNLDRHRILSSMPPTI